jgi:predicted O-methyltransferase YrrM
MKSISEFTSRPLALPLAELGNLFPRTGKELPPPSSAKGLDQWKMEEDDAPIFQFVYQSHRPRRHLEFGTWQGWGTVLCLESCGATVWTMNLADGETRPDGTWAYSQRVIGDSSDFPQGIVTANYGQDEQGERIYHRTDAGGYIGRLYREKGLGNRVCQIYCDSRQWDNSNYPSEFFDSVLIDGGHQPEVVISDTRKALQVLRSGGVIMWHDFCPLPEIRSQFDSAKGVTSGIESILPELQSQAKNLCWINPSWILLGIKK